MANRKNKENVQKSIYTFEQQNLTEIIRICEQKTKCNFSPKRQKVYGIANGFAICPKGACGGAVWNISPCRKLQKNGTFQNGWYRNIVLKAGLMESENSGSHGEFRPVQ